MTGHQVVAMALRDLGVDTVFGLMGDANMRYATDFLAAGGRFVKSVVDGASVGMADGYSRVTDRVGVATVTHGPGVTNSLTALTEAVRAGSRVLLLTGDAPAQRDNRQRVDLRGLAGVAGADYRAAHTAGDVADEIGIAFSQVSARRRPLLLDLPSRLLDEPVDYRPPALRPRPAQRPLPDGDALDEALGVIASARRPVVLAGRGAALSGATDALVAFADLLGAPLATTLLGRDQFRGHDFDLGVFGTLSHPVAIEAIAAADCVIAFGAGLNQYTTDRGALVRDRAVVQVDLEAAAIGRHAAVTAGLVADARAAAEAMLAQLAGVGLASSGLRTAALRERLAVRDPRTDFADRSTESTVDMRAAAIRLDELLPRDRIVVTDGGRFEHAVWPYLGVSRPTDFAHTVNFGSIGLGTAVALGAAAGRPDQLTVAAVGDGGGAMGLVEFITAVRHRLPVMVVVFNDGAYGAEHRKFLQWGIDPAYSLQEWPDFAEVARTFGGHGATVRTLGDLTGAVRRAVDGELPMLVDIRADPAAPPGVLP